MTGEGRYGVSAWHFFMKLAFAAPANALAFLSTALGSQASRLHFAKKAVLAAPASGLRRQHRANALVPMARAGRWNAPFKELPCLLARYLRQACRSQSSVAAPSVALMLAPMRIAGPNELFNVEHKSITDGLSKLPATYEAVIPAKKPNDGKRPTTLAPGIPQLVEPANDPVSETERQERCHRAQDSRTGFERAHHAARARRKGGPRWQLRVRRR